MQYLIEMPYRYEAKRPSAPVNPGGICAAALFFADHGIFVTQAGHNEILRAVLQRRGCPECGTKTEILSNSRSILSMYGVLASLSMEVSAYGNLDIRSGFNSEDRLVENADLGTPLHWATLITFHGMVRV